jgi:formylglycine-generating enzyme required for sulfatase activity/tRNA A-37 threonylcarbamoyl transferase component Bud32/dienelactone hydrolase
MADLLERLAGALGSRYNIEREIGHGGMATVYRARDLRLGRVVAIKVLHPDLAAAVAADRFLREIRIAAQLQHPHILTLIDSGEVDDLLYYVMPFVEGDSLRDRHARAAAQLPVSDVTRLLRDVVDALAYAHRQGVVHRDIKPDNVLIADRHALVVDFGVAKAMTDATATHHLTSVGVSLGTPTYMAPEQAAADPEADHRVDIYAVGVLAYELLAGCTPFTGPPQVVLAAQISATPEPLGKRRPGLPAALTQIVMRCLEKDPSARFQTAEELLAELEALATPSKGTQSAIRAMVATRAGRRRLAILAAVALVLLTAGTWTLTARSRRAGWVRDVAIPEIRRLVDIAGRPDSAWMLATRAAAIAPNDSVLNSLWPSFTSKVVIRTEPEGATVHRTWYRDSTAWELAGTTPTDSTRVPQGVSRYRIEKPGYRTVLRAGMPTALSVGPIVLDRTDAPHPEMVRVPGGARILAGVIGLDHEEPVALDEFLMDRQEVTNEQYKAFVDAGGYSKRGYWEYTLVRHGRPLSWNAAMVVFKDRTGRPGPATWEAGAPPQGQESVPVSGVSWYEAAAYAKFAGKELPTVFHWAHAAGIRLSQFVVPGSNFGTRGPAKPSTFAGMSPYGTFDMAGNVREWCANAVGAKRYILGGGWSDEEYQFTDAYAQDPFDRSTINGIRLMKPLKEDPKAALAMRPLAAAERDFSKERPIAEVLFHTYRQMYDYDRTDLAARVESRDTTPADWIVERVSYAAAYGGERVPANLYLPKRRRGPYQVVVFFPGSSALLQRSSSAINTRSFDFFIKSGRAVVHPIYKSTYERGDSITSDYANETNYYRDHVLMWAKDLRRTIDYLGTRPDIDTSKVAYYGVSWGGYLGGIMPAVEPRIRAAVLYVAGLERERGKPEVEPINFLPRIRIPVLMLNGRYDHFFPIESSQKPFFRLLGTAPERKRYIVYDGGHNVPRERLITESLDWLDKYLGLVR